MADSTTNPAPMNPIPNANETENYLVLAVIAASTGWAGHHGIDSSTWSAMVTSFAPLVIAAGAGIFSAFRNFNMKKVHEDAKVIVPGK